MKRLLLLLLLPIAAAAQISNPGGTGTFSALTGDATSTSTGGATVVSAVNGVAFSSLATGPLYNTTGTGVPSIMTTAQFASFLGALTGCGTAGNTYAPATNTCVAGSGGGLPTGAKFQFVGYTTAGTTGTPFSLDASLSATSGTFLSAIGGFSTQFGYDSFGDSLSNDTGASPSTSGYTKLINQEANSGPYSPKGVGGDASCDFSFRMLTALNPTDSGNPAASVDIGVNDANLYGLATGAQANFGQCLGAGIVHAASSSSTYRVIASSFTQTGGTWSVDNTFTATPGGETCTGNTCTMTHAVTVSPNGTYDLIYYLYGSSTGTFTVSAGAGALTDAITGLSTLSAQYGPLTPVHVGTTTAGVAHFSGITSGAATITITGTGAGQIGILEDITPPAAVNRGLTGPNIIVLGEPYQAANAISATTATYDTWIKNTVALFNGATSDGLSIQFADVRGATNFTSDMAVNAAAPCKGGVSPLHGNNCWHRKVADLIEGMLKPSYPYPANILAANLNPTTAFNYNPNKVLPSATAFGFMNTYFQNNPSNNNVLFQGMVQPSTTQFPDGAKPSEAVANIAVSGYGYCWGSMAASQTLVGVTPATVAIPLCFTASSAASTPTLEFRPNQTDPTTTGGIQSIPLTITARVSNGTIPVDESYTLAAIPSGSGATTATSLVLKNSTSTGDSGIRSLWLQASNGHGKKFEFDGATSFDVTDTVNTSLAASYTVIDPLATGTTNYKGFGLNIPQGTATFAVGTNVTSVVCATGYNCNNTRGTLTIVGGTATTGTIATVTFSAALSAAPQCIVTQNGGGSLFDLGNSAPSTTLFNITSGVTVATATLTVNYVCMP